MSQLIVFLVLAGCRASTIRTALADLARARSVTELENSIAQPGKIVFEKDLAANWSVPLSALLNLDHAKRQALRLVIKKRRFKFMCIP
jgi:hypothetical protein